MSTRLPVIHGLIARRLLINFRIDPETVTRILPAPFRAKIVNGFAIGGICLIRLEQARPRGFPACAGLSSENAAHRFAVTWSSGGIDHDGVYIPRRDTSSVVQSIIGGRMFPGLHHRSEFRVQESAGMYDISFANNDGTRARVRARHGSGELKDSVFKSLHAAHDFFRSGSVGYSRARIAGCFEGIQLRCFTWHLEPLEIETVASSFFEDHSRFPESSVEFDSVLLMRGIPHQWHACPPIVTAPSMKNELCIARKESIHR